MCVCVHNTLASFLLHVNSVQHFFSIYIDLSLSSPYSFSLSRSLQITSFCYARLVHSVLFVRPRRRSRSRLHRHSFIRLLKYRSKVFREVSERKF